MADDSPTNPPPEDLNRYVTQYDGESRPDLVPLWLRINTALASVSVVDSDLDRVDRELIAEFRLASVQDYAEEDGRLIDRMRRILCGRLNELDGKQVATEMERIDEALLAQRDARANDLIRSLTAHGAELVLAEGDKVAMLVKGAKTDIVAMADEFPEYVKEVYRDRCIALGYISPGNNGG